MFEKKGHFWLVGRSVKIICHLTYTIDNNIVYIIFVIFVVYGKIIKLVQKSNDCIQF